MTGLYKTNFVDGSAGHVTVHNDIGKGLNNLHYDVKWYGAKGDGITDDTVAITAAIADIPTTGGILFFPPGIYVTTGGFTIPNPTLIKGCGMVGEDGTLSPTSLITCSSDTDSLFTVTAYTARFRDIALVNTHADAPTAGAGVTCFKAGSWDQKVDFDSVSVAGFFVDIDQQTGEYWTMNNCMLFRPVKYALKIANTVNADSGDWSISSSYFISDVYSADAAIRIESSGGGKLINCKVNRRSAERFVSGINLN